MTNKEYIEKNNISFSDAMKMYDNEKYPCIDDWLNQEHFDNSLQTFSDLFSLTRLYI